VAMPAHLRTSLPSAIEFYLEEEVIITGVLEVLHEDRDRGSRHLYFFEASGKRSYLLDMTPATSSWSDPALVVDESFYDPNSGVTIAPLEERPEWRAELRRWVLSDELLTLPELVRALAEAQRRTAEQLGALIGVVHTLTLDVGELKGDAPRRYRERAYAYFAPLLRWTRVLAGDELMARLEEAVVDGQQSEAEAKQVSWADLVIQGRRRQDDTEVYLVVEASWQVDVEDVERAAERAALLGRIGKATVPVVAGKTGTEAAARLAQTVRVWQVTDGRVSAPER
jgi:hypothetical protein